MTTTNDTITLAEFIAAHGITMTAKRAASNRNMPDSGGMDHWLCSLRRLDDATHTRLATMRVTFSMGSGHHGKAPDAASVLSCLSSDASLAGDGFADFCANAGYDEDSRKAFRSFRQCERQTAKLRAFLTPEQFEQLLYGTEQL